MQIQQGPNRFEMGKTASLIIFAEAIRVRGRSDELPTLVNDLMQAFDDHDLQDPCATWEIRR